jgi:hypothetical protein
MKKLKNSAGTTENCWHGYRVVALSPELKDRVLAAAREAWRATPADDIPWTFPILRLAACLIAMALPVCWVHHEASTDVARFTAVEQDAAAAQQTAVQWAMTGQAHLASLSHLVTAPPQADAADALARHLRALSAELSPYRSNGG